MVRFIWKPLLFHTFYQRSRGLTTPWVWLIIGQGGIGKSRLLDQLFTETPQEMLVVRLKFAMSNMRGEPLSVLEEMLWQVEAPVDADQMRLYQQAFAEGKAKLEQPASDIRQDVHLAESAPLQRQVTGWLRPPWPGQTTLPADCPAQRSLARSASHRVICLPSVAFPAQLVGLPHKLLV
jgi:hypothetical protein